MINAGMNLGSVNVFTTVNRGFTAEEIAERALDKIIYVGDQSHPVITEQARAFKGYIKDVLIQYLREAQESERITLAAKLSQAGHPEIAKLLGEL